GFATGLPIRGALRASPRALHWFLPVDVHGWSRARRRLLEAWHPMIAGLASAEPLLRVEEIRKHYPFVKGVLLGRALGHIKAVDGVSFPIRAGETVGVVGESGCGKTTTSRLILNLETPTEGRVLLEGKSIHGLRGEALTAFRGKVQAVFQDPWSSLDPRMTV